MSDALEDSASACVSSSPATRTRASPTAPLSSTRATARSKSSSARRSSSAALPRTSRLGRRSVWSSTRSASEIWRLVAIDEMRQRALAKIAPRLRARFWWWHSGAGIDATAGCRDDGGGPARGEVPGGAPPFRVTGASADDVGRLRRSTVMRPRAQAPCTPCEPGWQVQACRSPPRATTSAFSSRRSGFSFLRRAGAAGRRPARRSPAGGAAFAAWVLGPRDYGDERPIRDRAVRVRAPGRAPR